MAEQVVGLDYRASAVWFLLHSAIILAVVQSNISWHWAYLATLIVSGRQPAIRGEDKSVQQMTPARKVAVLIAACLAAASAGLGKPAAACIDPDRPHAADRAPVAVRANSDSAAHPGGKPDPTSAPSRVALPPVEFDHEYKGKLSVLKEENYAFIRHVCRDILRHRLFLPYLRLRHRRTISCLIMLGPMAHNDARVMKHEIAHCNGWSNSHEGARHD